MRTLKKALSLVLVLAMVFALAVPGFAADTTKKASDFKDYSKVTNKEAVDVLTAVGVINGNADGTFAPEGNFTRAEAATMITYLTLGKTVANALPVSATKFSDVPATHWAAKYVQYCADAGIVNGVGNGKFDPDAKLTATQWSLMLLGALGYNAKNEGIGGEGWEIATTKLAMKAGVATAEDLTATFNRDMAAKLALNALKADVVEYATNGTNITIGDTTISTGSSKATPVTVKVATGKNVYATKIDGAVPASGEADVTVQLGEKLYNGKLELNGTGTNGADEFGRTVKTWLYNSKAVATGTSTAVATFTAATKAADVAAALAGYTLSGNAVNNTTVYKTSTTTAPFTKDDLIVNNNDVAEDLTVGDTTGETIAKAIADETANGKVVEIYATDKAIDKIVTVSYTTATVTGVKTTTKNGSTWTTYTLSDTKQGTVYSVAANGEANTAVVNGTVAKGDVVTYVQPTKVGGTGKLYIYPTTNFEGVQTATKTSNGVQTITVSGTAYTVGAAATGAFNNSTKGTSATYYVDQFGFVVYTNSKTTASTDYAYVLETEAKVETSTLAASAVSLKAKVILADGTVAVYPVALTKVDGADKYFIKGIGADDNLIFNAKDSSLNTSTDATNAANNATNGIKGKVLGYTITDGTIAFEKLTALPANTDPTTENTVYAVNATAVAKVTNATSFAANTDKTVLVNNSTVYVAYNTATGKTTVYTGNSALPTSINDLNGKTGATALAMVMKTGTTAKTGVASVVFFSIGANLTADATSDLVYVDGTFSTVVKDGKNTNEYTGYKADGTTVALYSSADDLDAGLYVPNKDNTIAAANKKAHAQNPLIVDGAKLTVDGSMVKSGSTWYYMTDSTKVVYVGKDLTEVNDNEGTMILVKDSNNVDVIYVTAD